MIKLNFYYLKFLKLVYINIYIYIFDSGRLDQLAHTLTNLRKTRNILLTTYIAIVIRLYLK